MTAILNWLNGNKTYIAAIILAVLAILSANGVTIPEYVYQVLAAFGIIAARSAIKKLEPVATDMPPKE